MKEYAKIVNCNGGYTEREIDKCNCRVGDIYEVKDLTRMTCKIIGEKGTIISVNSTDVTFLSPDEVQEYESSKIDTVEKLEERLSIKPDSYVKMIAPDTECAIVDDEINRADIKFGDTFYCKRIKNGCAYVTNAVQVEGKVIGHDIEPVYVVPGIYLSPFDSDAVEEKDLSQDEFEPVQDDVPFLDDEEVYQEPSINGHELPEGFSEKLEKIIEENLSLSKEYNSNNTITDYVAKALAMYLINKLGDKYE